MVKCLRISNFGSCFNATEIIFESAFFKQLYHFDNEVLVIKTSSKRPCQIRFCVQHCIVTVSRSFSWLLLASTFHCDSWASCFSIPFLSMLVEICSFCLKIICSFFFVPADFGVSAKNTHMKQRRTSFIGTPYWLVLLSIQ